ncbi:soluble lytic murein transglycosylase precursor [mine drainage metagenome]|uniref:Soluble lytic murein transglycosylase n=1 Tax=mine drainage metagenome TaxID=410659 RepID=A0A1J5RQM2_9ZZZZ
MKALERVPLLSAVTFIAVSVLGMQPVWAEESISTTGAGTVNSSNIQIDSDHPAMIPEPAAQIVAVSEAYTGKPLYQIADKMIYDRMVNRIARTYGVESALLHAVISVESRYRPAAISRAGAIGLMQLMPKTAKRYGVADPLDPMQNVRGGARYLRYLLKKYHNDRNLALAAYNAGEASVAKYGNQIPPYPETTDYVPRVMEYYRRYLVKG